MEKENIVIGWKRFTLVPENSREGHVDFKYWDKLFVLSMDRSDRALEIFVKLLQSDLTESQISELAAGPVEEFLVKNGFITTRALTREEISMFRQLRSHIWTRRLSLDVANWLANI